MLEGPARRHRQQTGGPGAVVRTEHLGQLLRRPGIRQALDALGVGVQRRGEAALRRPQLAQHPVAGLERHPFRHRRAGRPPQVGVDAQQQRVVVQHLLEVRHHPVGVDRVAREAARQLVVDTAAGHRLAGAARPSEVPRHHRCARGGAAAARAPSTAGTWGRRRSRRAPRRTTSTANALPRRAARATEPPPLPRRRARARPAPRRCADRPPAPRHVARTRSGPPRQAAGGTTACRAEGPAGSRCRSRRAALRRREHRHRPAAVTGQCRGGLHVGGVDVRPLLAVDLDGDEVLVEVGRDLGVLERLVRHHVAPVAGGVPDGDQHRDVPPPRLLEGLVAPLAASRPGCPGAAAGRATCCRRAGWASAHPAPPAASYPPPDRARCTAATRVWEENGLASTSASAGRSPISPAV